MAETVGTNQFKNGMHIEIEGGVWRIVDFQHVKPGKGGAFVRTKVKNIDTGAVVDKTFRAGEKFQRMHTEVKNAQYLYDSGDDVVFMEDDTYEQFSLPRATVGEDLQFIPPSSAVQVLTVDGRPSGLQLPPRPSVALQILIGVPPSASTLFSASSVKNANSFPSGDQKGNVAFSVPAI